MEKPGTSGAGSMNATPGGEVGGSENGEKSEYPKGATPTTVDNGSTPSRKRRESAESRGSKRKTPKTKKSTDKRRKGKRQNGVDASPIKPKERRLPRRCKLKARIFTSTAREVEAEHGYDDETKRLVATAARCAIHMNSETFHELWRHNVKVGLDERMVYEVETVSLESICSSVSNLRTWLEKVTGGKLSSDESCELFGTDDELAKLCSSETSIEDRKDFLRTYLDEEYGLDGWEVADQVSLEPVDRYGKSKWRSARNPNKADIVELSGPQSVNKMFSYSGFGIEAKGGNKKKCIANWKLAVARQHGLPEDKGEFWSRPEVKILLGPAKGEKAQS